MLPSRARCHRLEVSDDLRTPGLLELLMVEARGRGRRAIGWAYSAISAAERPEDQALGYALLGQALRREACLSAAASAFDRAADLIPAEGDPDLRAEALGLVGRWRQHLRDFDAAGELLRAALDLMPPGTDRHLHLRIAEATRRGQAGQPGAATNALATIALELRERKAADEWLDLVVGHNLASMLTLAGEHDLALRTLIELRALYLRTAGQSYAYKANWLAGRIALDLGQHEAADAQLSSVAASANLRDPIDCGLLELERAHAALGCGRWAEAGQRATRAAGLLGGLGIRVEATAAAITAAEAIQAGQVQALAAVVAARRRMGA
jgi:tetratricopeptide (TPR) repeat protein